jgi:hypothetical protein
VHRSDAADALAQEPDGEAVAYVDGHWCALTPSLEDGRLEIDVTDVERTLRGVAIGRKNRGLVGGDTPAQRPAIFDTLIEMCHRHDVNTWLYIKDVLKSVRTHPTSDIVEQVSYRWERQHPEAGQPPLDRR